MSSQRDLNISVDFSHYFEKLYAKTFRTCHRWTHFKFSRITRRAGCHVSKRTSTTVIFRIQNEKHMYSRLVAPSRRKKTGPLEFLVAVSPSWWYAISSYFTLIRVIWNLLYFLLLLARLTFLFSFEVNWILPYLFKLRNILLKGWRYDIWQWKARY